MGGRQYAFFASRRAPAEPTETEVGPFRIEILEPMGRHRLVIDKNTVEPALGRESWSCDELAPMAYENLHIQQIVIARSGDRVGHGVLEQVHLGSCAPYGFVGTADGFKNRAL